MACTRVNATREKFTRLAGLYGGRTPHSLPPEKRLTGDKLRRLAGL